MEGVKNSNNKFIYRKILIVSLIIVVGIIGVCFFLLHQDYIYKGVRIQDVDVGGMSILKAQDVVKKHFDQRLLDRRITFVYAEEVYRTSSQEVGYTYDYMKAVKEAYEVGRHGSVIIRIKKILQLYQKPHSIHLVPVYDCEKVEEIIHTIKSKINTEPKNAQIRRENKKFHVTSEIVGLKLDEVKTKEMLVDKLNEYKDEDIMIELPVQTICPTITSERLGWIEDVLGSYTTRFNTQKKERSSNVRLATQSINGILLMPKEVFSFNEVVGPRKKERGYKEAPVIFKGELVKGLGGGVCQVSSTLYNAVLLSNLKVIERYKHTFPSSYVPTGRDATVSYGVLDFRFENNLKEPIYIESFIDKNVIIINIYGHKTDNKVIKIVSGPNEVVKKTVEIQYSKSMLKNTSKIKQRGRNGHKITTYRVIYENGKVIDQQEISKDYYKPRKQVIIKGTRLRSTS